MQQHTMEFPISLALGKSVLGVELYDIASNTKLFTFHRKGSHCTFANPIVHGDFELTLRLDWQDLDDGEPTLDLDVKKRQRDGTHKSIKPARNPKHHTTLSSFVPGNTEPRIYDLDYEGLSMRLVARKTFTMGVGISMHIVDPLKSNDPPV